MLVTVMERSTLRNTIRKLTQEKKNHIQIFCRLMDLSLAI